MSEPVATPAPAAAGTPATAPSRPPDLMHDAVGFTPELSRKNMRYAWVLVALFLILFGGTFGIAELYLST